MNGKEKNTETSQIFLWGGALAWLALLILIRRFHPHLWGVLYGSDDCGSILFWGIQASFLVFLLIFKNKAIFLLIIIWIVWAGFAMQSPTQPHYHKMTFNPLSTRYQLCWVDPRGEELEPCTPKGIRKYGKMIVSITKYSHETFYFTVRMKEFGVWKNRAWFRWNKITSPWGGIWSQDNSKRKDWGFWNLHREGNRFVGWHTNKRGLKFPLTLTPIS